MYKYFWIAIHSLQLPGWPYSIRVSLALERCVRCCFALVWGRTFHDFLWLFDKFYTIFILINCSLIADYTQLDCSLQFALNDLSCLYKLCLLILAYIEIKIQDFDMWVKKFQNLGLCIHCSFIQIQIHGWLEYLFQMLFPPSPLPMASRATAPLTSPSEQPCMSLMHTVLQLLYRDRPKLPCNLIETEVINHL